ncbi:MAG: U32 family peptidase [Pirellulales bacterium]|nr:U32 family peptidase [Pirellulales bacterium]
MPFSCEKNLPELVAPAGSWEAARAAVENGADAVYFGLKSGLNARARAENFHEEELAELMTFLRRRGVRGYLALNTLVFSRELESLEAVARRAVSAGVDAVIVQDIGAARLLHHLCPALPLHASTQMTLSDAECIKATEGDSPIFSAKKSGQSPDQSLGIRRVVLPRELSIAEIAQIHRETPIELEVFVHGALCISYSGQCLASLALGGRSGNRGQCAQACRLPYDLASCEVGCQPALRKPSPRPSPGGRGRIAYPLSPRDLAAYDRLPELIAAGVSALKIEGRLKEPEYVALVTRRYRELLDALAAGKEASLAPREVEELEVAFSRGFCHGWLDGPNPHALVGGDSPGKRGSHLGMVRQVRGGHVVVELAAPVRRGTGVVFSGGEQGGRVFEVFQQGRSVEEEVTTGLVELTFGRDQLDLRKIQPGQEIRKTDDPQLLRSLRHTYSGKKPLRRVPLRITAFAAAGQKLTLDARADSGAACRIQSEEMLVEAEKHPLTEEVLCQQLGRLGGSVYVLDRLEATITGQPMVPLSVLGRLRRQMIEALDASLESLPPRELAPAPVLDALRRQVAESPPSPAPKILVLCRTLQQLRAALDARADAVIADFLEPGDLSPALHSARSEEIPLYWATCRIHSTEEQRRWRDWLELGIDGVLARNLAAIAYFSGRVSSLIADFSLNAVNELTINWLLEQGTDRVTTAYDLKSKTLEDLLDRTPPGRLEIIVHGRVPMFHTAHCLFCAAFSEGSRREDCGRPCRRRILRLKDRKGVAHPVLTDAACRNTVFQGRPFSTVKNIPALFRRGVKHFRIELLDESPEETVRLVNKV